jgi:cytochrome c
MIQKLLATACLLSLSAGIASAEGDAEKGEKVFRKCRACHAVGEGAENKVGPQLNGIVGRDIAALDGFGYSDALIELAAEKGAWTEEELAAFLEKPRSYAKGTKMSFAGLRKEDERADVIAYLATFTE